MADKYRYFKADITEGTWVVLSDDWSVRLSNKKDAESLVETLNELHDAAAEKEKSLTFSRLALP